MKTSVTGMATARFSVGELVHHRLFDYRGVIVDVEAEFSLTEEWYESVARTRPPRDEPWYQVLVHGASHMTYVAERNLEPDASREPIRHPMVDEYFSGMTDGRYVRDVRSN